MLTSSQFGIFPIRKEGNGNSFSSHPMQFSRINPKDEPHKTIKIGMYFCALRSILVQDSGCFRVLEQRVLYGNCNLNIVIIR